MAESANRANSQTPRSRPAPVRRDSGCAAFGLAAVISDRQGSPAAERDRSSAVPIGPASAPHAQAPSRSTPLPRFPVLGFSLGDRRRDGGATASAAGALSTLCGGENGSNVFATVRGVLVIDLQPDVGTSCRPAGPTRSSSRRYPRPSVRGLTNRNDLLGYVCAWQHLAPGPDVGPAAQPESAQDRKRNMPEE
jgi:hypothetical protein